MRARDRILHGSRRVTALLGPTNTGKTHRAIQRMLQHPSGMIGLPLRLLAREVYDRIVALRGADSVALITGEEKRVPPSPSGGPRRPCHPTLPPAQAGRRFASRSWIE